MLAAFVRQLTVQWIRWSFRAVTANLAVKRPPRRLSVLRDSRAKSYFTDFRVGGELIACLLAVLRDRAFSWRLAEAGDCSKVRYAASTGQRSHRLDQSLPAPHQISRSAGYRSRLAENDADGGEICGYLVVGFRLLDSPYPPQHREVASRPTISQ